MELDRGWRKSRTAARTFWLRQPTLRSRYYTIKILNGSQKELCNLWILPWGGEEEETTPVY
jgi:hypothetical protein